jgi:hypothetical protein
MIMIMIITSIEEEDYLNNNHNFSLCSLNLYYV